MGTSIMANSAPSDHVRVFIGAPITNRTERKFLAQVRQSLQAAGEDAVILANFQIGSDHRQIDFLVATTVQAVAVELKGYRHPVVGTESGEWEIRCGDSSRSIGFPYAQALNNRFALTDALRRLLRERIDAREAIAGMLCIYPEVPGGSSIPLSNRKLAVGDFAAFRDLLRRRSSLPLPLSKWEELAERLNLAPLSAAAHEEERAVVGEYLAHCADLAEVAAGPFVEAHLDQGEGQKPLPPLVPMLSNGGRIHLVGPSGVGKTRLVVRLVAEAARQGILPLAVAARDFEGQLLPLLRKCVARGTARRFETVMGAAEVTGTPILVCVDALNECSRDRLPELVSALQTATLRYGATILLTGQTLPDLPVTLDGEIIKLAQPDRDRARRLTEAHLGRPLETAEATMLEIVASAQDASVLAEVLSRHSSVDGRFALYHAFTLDRLPESPHRYDLHAALGELAMQLRESYATKIPASASARLLGQFIGNGIAGARALAEAEAAALVIREDGDVRFRHDLIADYFAADRLLRRTGEADLVQEAIRPINGELQEFILGGCSTSQEAMRLIDADLADATVDAALYGRCGERPRRILLDRCQDVIARIEAAYSTLHFTLPTEGDELPGRAAPFFPEPFNLSPGEMKAVFALSAAVNADLFERVMRMFDTVDAHLWAEARRLRAENPDLKRNIPAMVFGSLYGEHFQPEGADLLRRLFNNIVNERIIRRNAPLAVDVNAELDRFESKSPGQLFLLLSMHRSCIGTDLALPCRTTKLIPHVWRLGIYHLRLLLMDMIHLNGRRAPQEQREEIFDILNGYLSDNAWINMIVIDALSAVGEIEFGLTPENIAADYEEIARQPLTEDIGRRALSAYVATYDHPASDLFSEAFFEGISAETRSAVLVRALADPDADPMSLDFAIRDLGRHMSTEAVPLLRKFALAPKAQTGSIQASVALFAEAISQLARLGEPLPALPDPSADADLRAWQMVRPLIHAFNLSPEPSQRIIDEFWASFRAAGEAAAVNVLLRLMRECGVFRGDVRLEFIRFCSDGVRELCLRVLEPNYVPSTMFRPYERPNELLRRHRQFALACLAEVGRSSDRNHLECWREDPTVGTDAIRALRAIERR